MNSCVSDTNSASSLVCYRFLKFSVEKTTVDISAKQKQHGWIDCLETGGAAWKASHAALLSLRNSSADCNAATAIL